MAWHELEDWRQAERELHGSLCCSRTTENHTVIIGTDPGGFAPGSLEIWVAPTRVTLSGDWHRVIHTTWRIASIYRCSTFFAPSNSPTRWIRLERKLMCATIFWRSNSRRQSPCRKQRMAVPHEFRRSQPAGSPATRASFPGARRLSQFSECSAETAICFSGFSHLPEFRQKQNTSRLPRMHHDQPRSVRLSGRAISLPAHSSQWRGITLDTYTRLGTFDEAETAVRSWLRKKIHELENTPFESKESKI
jgi:hypothetical protein